ncbi:MAG: hypothetical protein AMXMBFR37_06890 [Steroidobacteraceae bacterium]|jgi:uncharacterized GH25 family protein
MMKLNRSLVAAVAATGMALGASAHEMFLKSEGHILQPGPDQVVRLLNGTFDISENAITRDRMADVSIVADGKVIKPPPSAWYDDESSSYLKYDGSAPGTYVIAVSTLPKVITMSSEDFVKYLKHDGILDTLEKFEQGSKPASVRERYSKHVRSIVQIGDKRTDDYRQVLGYPIEIIFDQNPYSLKFGKELSFVVLHEGKPLANQLVYASYEGFHQHNEAGEHLNSIKLRTDADGRAKFLLSNKALWYISLVHMQKVDEKDVDYVSNWATATFSVQ